MRLAALLSSLTLLWCIIPTWGASVIVVGDHELQPNLAGQQVQIFVTGNDQVEGLNFNIQVGAGGARILDLDILTGTIFASNNTGTSDPDGPGAGDLAPLWEGRTTTTSGGTVVASGLLGTVTFDTTGLFGGTWGLSMSQTSNGPTDFADPDILLDITDGSIFIRGGSQGEDVPEPATTALLGLASVALAGYLRRRRAAAIGYRTKRNHGKEVGAGTRAI